MTQLLSNSVRNRLLELFAPEGMKSGSLNPPLVSQAKEADLRRVDIRPIRVKGTLLWQFGYVRGKNVVHKNLDATAAVVEFERLLSEVFTKAILHGTTVDLSLKRAKNGELLASERPIVGVVREIQHDRVKQRILPDGVPVDFLIRLGVMASDGRVLAHKYDKFKQINRYLELVSDTWDALSAGMAPDAPLNIVDFGSGKSYLTFALYHYFHKIKGLNVCVVGLDLKEDVIAECSAIAADLGYSGLSFAVGDIAGYRSNLVIDMVVSLHACDTATDDALHQAVGWNAKVIFAAPCCQHELFGQIASDVNRPLLKHGILKERLAALITDAMRAEWLETVGYSVQVLEFIETVHTPKNLLIRAVKAQSGVKSKSRHELEAFKQFWHVNPSIEGSDSGIRPACSID